MTWSPWLTEFDIKLNSILIRLPWNDDNRNESVRWITIVYFCMKSIFGFFGSIKWCCVRSGKFALFKGAHRIHRNFVHISWPHCGAFARIWVKKKTNAQWIPMGWGGWTWFKLPKQLNNTRKIYLRSFDMSEQISFFNTLESSFIKSPINVINIGLRNQWFKILLISNSETNWNKMTFDYN